jgi:hypothetical protein
LDLVHCIYCSASSQTEFGQLELRTLLNECRLKNAADDITGILLYLNGSFFQVLEGKSSAVEALFEKIASDKRHRRVTKVILEPIAERAFGAWTMGCPELSSSQLGQIPGLNDFFARGQSYVELDEGRAKILLTAFTEGRWRAALS